METPETVYFDARPNNETDQQTYIGNGLAAAELRANTANEDSVAEAKELHFSENDTVVTIFDALAIDYNPHPAATPEMTTVSSDETGFKDAPSKTDHDWD